MAEPAQVRREVAEMIDTLRLAASKAVPADAESVRWAVRFAAQRAPRLLDPAPAPTAARAAEAGAAPTTRAADPGAGGHRPGDVRMASEPGS